MSETTIGEDRSYVQSDNGNAETDEIGGFGEAVSDYRLETNEALAAADAQPGYDTRHAYAAVWEEIYPTGITSQYAKFTINGSYKGMLDSLAGGSRVRWQIFLYSDSDEEELDVRDVIDITSNSLDFWSDSGTFSERVIGEIEPYQWYAIGLRVDAGASSFGTSVAHADIYNDGTEPSFDGYGKWDKIELEWL